MAEYNWNLYKETFLIWNWFLIAEHAKNQNETISSAWENKKKLSDD